MDRVLTDWQKAVNIIAHALNRAGYDGDSPESKALELLAGRCEGTANAETIAVLRMSSFTVKVADRDDNGVEFNADVRVVRLSLVEELLAPLLKPSVDVGKLADDFKREYEVYRGFNPEEAERNESSNYSPSVDELAEFFRKHLTDSSAEVERLVCDTCNDYLDTPAYCEVCMQTQKSIVTDSSAEIERLKACQSCGSPEGASHGSECPIIQVTRLEAELDKVKGDKDGAYTERNRLVAFIASLFPSQQCKTNIEGWDPEWHGCVFIETPAGQLSWHFHDSDAGLFDHVPYGSPVWDGHTTPEKYERVKSLINIRALTDSPAEIERLNGELNSLSESFGAVSEDYSNAQQEIERLRALVETCWQCCLGNKPGLSINEVHAALYHYMHDKGRVGCATAALSETGGEGLDDIALRAADDLNRRSRLDHRELDIPCDGPDVPVNRGEQEGSDE